MEIWIEKWNNERKTSLWRKKVTIPNTTFHIKDEIPQCKPGVYAEMPIPEVQNFGICNWFYCVDC